MPSFYVRDQLGRFTDKAAAGPAARSFEDYFKELATRPPTPSGHMLADVDDVNSKVYLEGGYGHA